MSTPITSSTTIKSGLGIFALGLLSVAVLNACGGGDAVTVAATTTTTSTTTTFVTSSSLATPTAQVTAGAVRYMIQGFLGVDAVSKEGTTTTASLTYGTNNAVIGLDNHSLAPTNGTYAVQEFSGDATFAQGRWTKGQPTINGVVSSTTLTGTSTAALHYLITRDMASFPANGVYTCGTNVRSTGLTYSGGTTISNPMQVGVLVPDATITISGSGATLNVNTLTLYAGGTISYEPAATMTFTSVGAGPAYTGNYLTEQEGIAYVLGVGTTANEITLGIALRRKMSNDTFYKGMTSVICK